MRAAILALTTGALLVACATPVHLIEAWHGAPLRKVLLVWDPPNARERVDDRTEILSYSGSLGGPYNSPYVCEPLFTIVDGFVTDLRFHGEPSACEMIFGDRIRSRY